MKTNAKGARLQTGGLAAGLLVLGLTGRSAANGPPPGAPGAPDGRVTWSLGAGLIQTSDPYRGSASQRLVVPFVGVEASRLSVRGIGAGLELLRQGDLRIGAVGRFRMDGYAADDSAFLAGMRDRRRSFDAGLEARYERRSVGAEISLVSDVLGRSGGQEAAAAVFVPIALGYARLRPSLGLAWQSSSLVDYYYGVRPEEARRGRPAYAPASATSLRVGLDALVPLSPRLAIVGSLRGERLAAEIRSSPLVDASFRTTGVLGLSYRF